MFPDGGVCHLQHRITELETREERGELGHLLEIGPLDHVPGGIRLQARGKTPGKHRVETAQTRGQDLPERRKKTYETYDGGRKIGCRSYRAEV